LSFDYVAINKSVELEKTPNSTLLEKKPLLKKKYLCVINFECRFLSQFIFDVFIGQQCFIIIFLYLSRLHYVPKYKNIVVFCLAQLLHKRQIAQAINRF